MIGLDDATSGRRKRVEADSVFANLGRRERSDGRVRSIRTGRDRPS